MRRALLTLLLLTGSALGQSPLDRAAGTAAGAITPRVNAAVDKVAPPPRALPPAKNPQCRMLAAQLIVRWEVTSPSYYERRLVRPIWPKGASGVTWGIGYDGGHQRRSVIEDDWSDHEHVVRLADTAGITGPRAGEALPRFRDIATPFPHAYRIFADRSLVEYERRAERAFGVDMAEVPPGICATLVSLTYNRGGSMTGDSRLEMRAIRDTCLPFDAQCVAVQTRRMCRLWRGTVNERGLCARRDMEADYATGALP